MQRRAATRIERAVDAGASALLGAAAAYAIHGILAETAVGMALGGGTTFAACFTALRRVEPSPVRDEDAASSPTPVSDLLAEADRSLSARAQDELVLEDILASLGPNSRVVRLFDAAAMPPPGQVQPRIGSHIGAPADASQALHDALFDLRRSLK
jgi:hypothetical protein